MRTDPLLSGLSGAEVSDYSVEQDTYHELWHRGRVRCEPAFGPYIGRKQNTQDGSGSEVDRGSAAGAYWSFRCESTVRFSIVVHTMLTQPNLSLTQSHARANNG